MVIPLSKAEQLSLFGVSRGGTGKASAPKPSTHLETVEVRAHARHTEHGVVEVPSHVRMVMKTSGPAPASERRTSPTPAPAPTPPAASSPVGELRNKLRAQNAEAAALLHHPGVKDSAKKRIEAEMHDPRAIENPYRGTYELQQMHDALQPLIERHQAAAAAHDAPPPAPTPPAKTPRPSILTDELCDRQYEANVDAPPATRATFEALAMAPENGLSHTRSDNLQALLSRGLAEQASLGRYRLTAKGQEARERYEGTLEIFARVEQHRRSMPKTARAMLPEPREVGYMPRGELRAPDTMRAVPASLYARAKELQDAEAVRQEAHSAVKDARAKGKGPRTMARLERALVEAGYLVDARNRSFWSHADELGVDKMVAARTITPPAATPKKKKKREPKPPPEPDPALDLSRAGWLGVELDPNKPDDRRHVERIFGRWVEPHELVKAIGLEQGDIDGASVSVYRNGSEVVVDVESSELHAARVFKRYEPAPESPGGLVCHNSTLDIYKTGTGRGTKIFSRQVDELRKLGAAKIVTYAAGSPTDPSGMNGYWTWPRMGYDGPLAAHTRAKLPSSLKDAARVSDLMRTAEGRDWWKNVGGDYIDVTFDLSPRSQSGTVLRRYLREKAAQAKEKTRGEG